MGHYYGGRIEIRGNCFLILEYAVIIPVHLRQCKVIELVFLHINKKNTNCLQQSSKLNFLQRTQSITDSSAECISMSSFNNNRIVSCPAILPAKNIIESFQFFQYASIHHLRVILSDSSSFLVQRRFRNRWKNSILITISWNEPESGLWVICAS